ncbi:four helix bundle protein [bacterium]|nr:four helix bundle protein [bacterium]
MAQIRHHKEMHVWQNAMDAAMAVFTFTQRLPRDERYSLSDQIRRSSRSVAANIAESWCRRRYKAAFIAKLYDAASEVAETQTWLEFARRCGYLSDTDTLALMESYDRVMGQLMNMVSNPDQWSTASVPATDEPAT